MKTSTSRSGSCGSGDDVILEWQTPGGNQPLQLSALMSLCTVIDCLCLHTDAYRATEGCRSSLAVLQPTPSKHIASEESSLVRHLPPIHVCDSLLHIFLVECLFYSNSKSLLLVFSNHRSSTQRCVHSDKYRNGIVT